MDPRYDTMSAAEIEQNNTILWGSLMLGCVLMSGVIFQMIYQNPDFYNTENFYTSTLMYVAVAIAIGGYFFGNSLYQKKAEEGSKLRSLNEKIHSFRASFVAKAALLEGPTLICILFMFWEQNIYFLLFAIILLVAQYFNRPTNERFINDFKLTNAQKQEFLNRG